MRTRVRPSTHASHPLEHAIRAHPSRHSSTCTGRNGSRVTGGAPGSAHVLVPSSWTVKFGMKPSLTEASPVLVLICTPSVTNPRSVYGASESGHRARGVIHGQAGGQGRGRHGRRRGSRAG